MSRILIIEDDTLIADFMQRSLLLDDHRVDTENSGKNGYRMALNNAYDVIILDLLVPHMQGLDICRKLREADVSSSILIVSSKVSEESRVAGLDAGADDYLVKPFGYKELNARVRALTRRVKALEHHPIHKGELTYQGPGREILFMGQALDLKPREYDVLERLITSTKDYVSKEELLQTIWMVSPESSSNRLEACISSIRKKLRLVNTISTIKTKRYKGYKIIV